MNDYVSIGQAAALIGVAVVTLRRWEKEGKLLSSFRTFGKHRRYKVSDVLLLVSDAEPRINICYSRVSSHDQKADLQRQSEALERYCEEHGLGYEVIQDLGSGLNFKKKGLVFQDLMHQRECKSRSRKSHKRQTIHKNYGLKRKSS
ncbi:MerR family DNA-binding transcriptional regulator [Vibrio vulnificus]|nr:MerR family DNA-binding transcriptional regulator [Vibrio vulnificus]